MPSFSIGKNFMSLYGDLIFTYVKTIRDLTRE